MAKREAQDYYSHCWVNDDRIIVGTDTGTGDVIRTMIDDDDWWW